MKSLALACISAAFMAVVAATDFGEVVAITYDIDARLSDQYIARLDLNKPAGSYKKIAHFPNPFLLLFGDGDWVINNYYLYDGYQIKTFDSVTLKQVDGQYISEAGLMSMHVDSMTGTIYGVLMDHGVRLSTLDPTTGDFTKLHDMDVEMACYLDGSAFDSLRSIYYLQCDHFDDPGKQGPMAVDASHKHDKLYMHRLQVTDDGVEETLFKMEDTILSLTFSEVIQKLVGWQFGVGIVSIDGDTGEVETILSTTGVLHGHPDLFSSTCSAEEPICFFNIGYGYEDAHSVLVNVATGELLMNDLNPGTHHWTKVFWQESEDRQTE